MERFDYTISNKKENDPVGYIIYCYSNEKIDYYSEKELLEEYKDAINYEGVNSVEIKVYSHQNNKRHGLRYAITEVQYNEFGLDYSREEYEKELKKIQNKEKKLELRR